MILQIAIVPGNYRLKKTQQEYLENVFLELRKAALARYPDTAFQSVNFVFEQDCELFKRFLPISKLHSLNWSLESEVILSDYPLAIVSDRRTRNKAKRLKIPSFTL